MRVSEERYARDQGTLELGVRLIQFKARTGTIRALTGLSADRIRKLFRSCGMSGKVGSRDRRRGATPRCVGHLLAKPRVRNEASTLFSLCRLMGVTPSLGDYELQQGGARQVRAQRLCDVYWTFRRLFPDSPIEFEHLLLLLSEAARGEEMAVRDCAKCRALMVVDILTVYSDRCPRCIETGARLQRPPEPSRLRCVAEEPTAYG